MILFFILVHQYCGILYFCYLLGRYQELNEKIERMETQLENCDSQIRRLEEKGKLDKEKLMEIRKLEQQVEVSFFFVILF